MKILILNGSPRAKGNTAAMIAAFQKGAEEAGHKVEVVSVTKKKIAGCIGCEYCHTKGDGECVQKDDMQEIYPMLKEADMIVLASPIYYYGITGQLQCLVSRIYAIGVPEHLKKAALFLAAGDNDAFEGAIYAFRRSFVEYMKLEEIGIVTVSEKEKDLDEKRKLLEEMGRQLL